MCEYNCVAFFQILQLWQFAVTSEYKKMLSFQELVSWIYTSSTMGYGRYLALAIIGLMTLRAIKRVLRKSMRGEVVLITGASSGIGEALAKEFHSRGAKVILTSRRLKELERVKTDILQDQSGFPPEIVVMDLGDSESIDAKLEEAHKIHGTIDIVVHNAGILSRGEVAETDLKVFKDIMQVNYFGVVGLTLALLPRMILKKKGHIVTVSSVQGRFALPRRAAYAASKHAVCAFMDSLRAEVASSGVVVTCVHPGYVKTNIAETSLTASGDAYGDRDPNIDTGYDPTTVSFQ